MEVAIDLMLFLLTEFKLFLLTPVEGDAYSDSFILSSLCKYSPLRCSFDEGRSREGLRLGSIVVRFFPFMISCEVSTPELGFSFLKGTSMLGFESFWRLPNLDR